LEILLVEDSWIVGEAMKDLLERLGAGVSCNRNVEGVASRSNGRSRQDAKRLDLVSYALVFLLIAIAAEGIVAALIW
jgi:hypothetical protein